MVFLSAVGDRLLPVLECGDSLVGLLPRRRVVLVEELVAGLMVIVSVWGPKIVAVVDGCGFVVIDVCCCDLHDRTESDRGEVLVGATFPISVRSIELASAMGSIDASSVIAIVLAVRESSERAL